MPNRRAHDHIGQLTQKLGIRIGDAAVKVINQLKNLVNTNITVNQIDKIVDKVISDPKFLNLFIKDSTKAAMTIGIKWEDLGEAKLK